VTTPTSAPISLDDVRQRFVQAESSLNELTDALKSLRNSSERFDDARGGLRDASQRLISLSDQFAAATQALGGSIELVRQAIGVLERSEPARVLAALEQLERVVQDVNVALESSAERLTQDVQEVGEVLKRVEAFSETAESREAARMSALQEILTQAAEAQAARLTESAAAIQKLAKGLADQHAAIDQARGELAAGRRWTLTVIVAMGALIVVLQLVQLLR
jgi:ABC-type transporter Mla subunit MlaD